MRTRITAAILHFLLGAFVISLSLYVIYYIWYPKPFYTLFSVFDAVKVVLLVDLTLGPFLTLVIYNTQKARAVLIRDILTIIIFQASALSWGLHITYKMRPLFMVFQGETFYPIIKDEIDLNDLPHDITAPKIWQKPKTVYIEPLKGEAAIQRMTNIVTGGEIKGEMYQAERYKPISLQVDSEYRRAIVKQALQYVSLQNSRGWKEKIDKFVLSKNGKLEDYLFYPVETDLYRGLIVFEKKEFLFAGLVSGE